MRQFDSRWRNNERKVQAFIDLQDQEKILKEQNQMKGRPTKVVSIQIPYTWATVSAIVTYLLHTFTGRKPMFQVGSLKAETAASAQTMELLLQYNMDHCQGINKIYQHCWDGCLYGLGAFSNAWNVEYAKRTEWVRPTGDGLMGSTMGAAGLVKRRVDRKIYEGNEVSNIDPFMFFPDPRVPMTSVHKDGEFCFARSFQGRHKLKQLENQGSIAWVDAIPQLPAKGETGESDGASDRGLVARGEGIPGWNNDSSDKGSVGAYVQIDQGTCWIIPRELGLSDVETPELWLFAYANNSQIIQAEPLDLDHGWHPVAVSEPLSIGYGFGQMSFVDFLGDIQDTSSWYINSHIMNVRSALNNMFIYDPSMVEDQDIKRPGPEKLIRLKKAAFGVDVRTVIQQLQVQDVTSGHIGDMEVLHKIGDMMSGVSDNLRGIQDSGGRKTATEVRTGAEAGASRLAALARVISSQSLTTLTAQMSLNLQQNLNDDFMMQVVGIEGLKNPIRVAPEMIAGDFHYPVNDGTLPIDKVAMLDIWKEVLLGVAQEPTLRATWSLPRIFEHVAKLGGAQNIESFRASPEEGMQQLMAAGMAPAGPPQGAPPPTA
jgi:hypothetical protein